MSDARQRPRLLQLAEKLTITLLATTELQPNGQKEKGLNPPESPSPPPGYASQLQRSRQTPPFRSAHLQAPSLTCVRNKTVVVAAVVDGPERRAPVSLLCFTLSPRRKDPRSLNLALTFKLYTSLFSLIIIRDQNSSITHTLSLSHFTMTQNPD